MQMQVFSKTTQEQMGAPTTARAATINLREVVQEGMENQFSMVGPSQMTINCTLADAEQFDVGSVVEVTVGVAA